MSRSREEIVEEASRFFFQSNEVYEELVRLENAGPRRPLTAEQIVQRAFEAIRRKALAGDYGRGPAMSVIEKMIRPPIMFGDYELVSITPGGVTRYARVDRKAKTAKNKRRSRARWRRRELRRSAGATALAAAALPALAPSVGSATAGEPGSETGFWLRIGWDPQYPLGWEDPDGAPVPLPKSEAPEERPFMPNKFGEHD